MQLGEDGINMESNSQDNISEANFKLKTKQTTLKLSHSGGSVTAKSKVKPSSPKKYNQQSLVALATHGKNLNGAQGPEDSSDEANVANSSKRDPKNIALGRLIKQEKEKGG